MKHEIFIPKKCIAFLSAIGERQLVGEVQARRYIEDVLAAHDIKYRVQEYEVEIPRYGDCGLLVDGRQIDVQPCGLRSGEIPVQDTILSSLISSQKNIYDANINFNPRCETISKSNHYHAPALAVARGDVNDILHAQEARAWMNVERIPHTSANILVGNIQDPKILVVSHYDSINSGAVDNASGIALSLDLIINEPEMLETTCFAICGNEEISFDEPVYWGHGYRVLEQDYPQLIHSSQRIIVADSFGYSDMEVIKDKQTLMLGFPIEGIDNVLEKTEMISGEYAQLMNFYHSNSDLPALMKDTCYQQVRNYCLAIMSSYGQR